MVDTKWLYKTFWKAIFFLLVFNVAYRIYRPYIHSSEIETWERILFWLCVLLLATSFRYIIKFLFGEE